MLQNGPLNAVAQLVPYSGDNSDLHKRIPQDNRRRAEEKHVNIESYRADRYRAHRRQPRNNQSEENAEQTRLYQETIRAVYQHDL